MGMQSLALASIFAACALGCNSGSASSPVKSSGIATADLEADIEVSASEPGRFTVEALLEREIGDEVDHVALNGDDEFSAVTPDGQTRTLHRLKSSTRPRYGAKFETSPAEGDVRVRFRGNPLTVTLHAEFTVTSPTPGQVFGFQDDLVIAWTPGEPGHTIVITIARHCPMTTGGKRNLSSILQVPDTGDYAFDLALIPEATDPTLDTSQDCSLEVELVRAASADITPPFASGSGMRSRQVRSVEGLFLTF